MEVKVTIRFQCFRIIIITKLLLTVSLINLHHHEKRQSSLASMSPVHSFKQTFVPHIFPLKMQKKTKPVAPPRMIGLGTICCPVLLA